MAIKNLLCHLHEQPSCPEDGPTDYSDLEEDPFEADEKLANYLPEDDDDCADDDHADDDRANDDRANDNCANGDCADDNHCYNSNISPTYRGHLVGLRMSNSVR